METKLTDMEQCIGCGHSEFNTDTGEYLECRRCGMITEQAKLTALNSALAADQRRHPDQDPLLFRRITACQAAVLRAVRFRTLHTASTGHACGRESGSALIGRKQGK